MKDSGEGARNLGTSLARATHFARLLRSGVEIQGVSSTPISSRASKLSRKAWHFIAQNQARRGHVLVNKAARAKLEGVFTLSRLLPDDHDMRVDAWEALGATGSARVKRLFPAPVPFEARCPARTKTPLKSWCGIAQK
jgi:hypothetical protein